MRPDNELLQHAARPDSEPLTWREWLVALCIILVLAVDWVGLLFG